MSKELIGYLAPDPSWQPLVGTLSMPTAAPSDITVKRLTATENRVYQEDGVAYSPVTVDVPGIVPSGSLEITENGQYDATEYAEVDVDVPGLVPAGTKQITTNGTHNVAEYAAAQVNVAPNTAPKTVNENGTYSASTDGVDGFSSVTVDVPMPDPKVMGKAFVEGTITSYEDDTVTTVRSYAFNNCPNITSFKCHNAEYAGAQIGYGVPIEKLAFPKLKSFGTGTFYGMSKAQVLDVGLVTGIPNMTFNGCSALKSIILRSDGLVALHNAGAFNASSFAAGGAGGTIYIKKALYDHLGDGSNLDYQAATNWTTVYGRGTITWAQLEGSYYETHYGDDTPIPAT